MKVLMVPHLEEVQSEESGIRRVIESYFKHLPEYGIELVPPKSTSCDIKASHAGSSGDCNVVHCHGLYWTADYVASIWEWKVNQWLAKTCRQTKEITVPSEWVAETFRRDMRINPHVIGHGIDLEEWKPNFDKRDFALWNKNRSRDVCDPAHYKALAEAYPDKPFVSTLMHGEAPPNMALTGVIPHAEMKKYISDCAVYVSTTKETFGIGILEAMATGTPILGYGHGGIMDIVEHGVNGYLAQPGNVDDLIEGYAYCIKNARTLGENGLEMVKKFRWTDAARKVAAVYEKALEIEDPTCAIIIPCYNYSGRVSKAIEGAINQTYGGLTDIVIVDDGSDDGDKLRDVVNGYSMADSRVKLIRQDNKGVAIARNAGIAATETKYVCCLDADDTLEPTFIDVCVEALEKDRTLGIAYTGLWYIKPDATEGRSKWPGKWDYNEQLARKNQIPTCCVFRKEMWKRLGGYRQRYAPMGAGSEDAEFWTRSGAYGYKAEMVTHKPLFIYSWMSGRVSGNPEYKEVDWLDWHPWVKDHQHPFFSLAKPGLRSHPARQYDEPAISVIIPVGPGHARYLVDSLDSLEAQTLRQWEAIVVWDSDEDIPQSLMDCYPYVRWYHNEGEQGAGAARNTGVTKARAPFIVFLDADDYLVSECLELMLEAWKDEEAIVYTDYVGRAFIDDFSALAPDLQGKVYQTNKKTNESFIGYRSADYDYKRAQAQPIWTINKDGRLKTKPYHWCIMTSLIPKKWHEEIGGFDENMVTWEDIDYHWRMARAGKCYTRIAEELVVYRFYSGLRREKSYEQWQSILEYIEKKYEGIDVVGCNCGKPISRVTKAHARLMRPEEIIGVQKALDTDEKFVLVKYLHPNRGNHHVIGSSTKTKYGYRAGGNVFLVHIDDINAQPHLFEAAEKNDNLPKNVPQKVAPPKIM